MSYAQCPKFVTDIPSSLTSLQRAVSSAFVPGECRETEAVRGEAAREGARHSASERNDARRVPCSAAGDGKKRGMQTSFLQRPGRGIHARPLREFREGRSRNAQKLGQPRRDVHV